jgi:hypothetical protein
MKKHISKLIILMVPLLLLFSCNKDKFSEKDALNAQQTVDLLVTVIDASTSMAPVDGATVVLISDSTIVTKTTNTSGIVVFPNIAIGGSATVSVSKTDFTPVLKSVYTNPDSYRQTQVSTIVSLYSLESSKIATFQGRLTMQSDLTDRNREPAEGFTVKASNNNLNSTGQLFTAVTDADGKYSISVPVSSNGDDITLYYPDFTANQTLAIVKPDNSVGVVTRSVLYKTYNGNNPIGDAYNIPAIPSIYATIAAPPAVTGSGFALGSKPNRVSLTSYTSTPLLIDGGSGYAKGRDVIDTLLLFSADPHGVSSKLEVDITKGKITRIYGIVNNGATYSAAPTLQQNGATTSAIISMNFETTYKIYIANKGTSYNAFPVISAETESYSSGRKVIAVDADITDGSAAFLGIVNILSNTAIYTGNIISLSNGDTLIAATSDSYSSAPVFTVLNTVSKPARITVTTAGIGADSTLGTVTLSYGGTGYNPIAPPAVTLTTIGGYGSGAVAKAVVNASGVVTSIVVTNPGTRYVQNVNDYRKASIISNNRDYADNPSTYSTGVKPGDVIVQDVYYGTGYQVLNQSTGK